MNELVGAPRFIAFEVAEALQHHAAVFGATDQTAALHRLAAALQASKPWQTLAGSCTMVTSPGPEPRIAVIGRFDAAGEQRLFELARTFDADLATLRYVAWTQVRRDVATLAATLRTHLGGAIADARFTAIPRGGLIVLGLLAYELDLSPTQLDATADPGPPLVIVDDCSLTGLRFGEVLREHAAPEVIFAHLYSTPDLRHAVARHSRVTACVAAQDLTDRAPALLGDGYHAWQVRWAQRTGNQTSWVGITERIAFPWSEPDATFWNEATQEDEAGWKLVPPEFCAGNACEPAIQLNSWSPGPVRPPSSALWAEFGDETLVADRKTGQIYSLDGVAADMWRALVELGDIEKAANRLASGFDATPAQIRNDLAGLVSDLSDAGVLVSS